MSKIENVGDWGSYRATLDGQMLVDGEWLQVMWPDGKNSKIQCRVVIERGEVYDHGKSYDTQSNVAYHVTKVHGIEVKIPLAGLTAQRVKAPRKRATKPAASEVTP